MVKEFSIERESEKRALFGVGIVGSLKIYADGKVKAEMFSLIDEGVVYKMEFANYAFARKHLVFEDGKNRQKLSDASRILKVKKADKVQPIKKSTKASNAKKAKKADE